MGIQRYQECSESPVPVYVQDLLWHILLAREKKAPSG